MFFRIKEDEYLESKSKLMLVLPCLCLLCIFSNWARGGGLSWITHDNLSILPSSYLLWESAVSVLIVNVADLIVASSVCFWKLKPGGFKKIGRKACWDLLCLLRRPIQSLCSSAAPWKFCNFLKTQLELCLFCSSEDFCLSTLWNLFCIFADLCLTCVTFRLTISSTGRNPTCSQGNLFRGCVWPSPLVKSNKPPYDTTSLYVRVYFYLDHSSLK